MNRPASALLFSVALIGSSVFSGAVNACEEPSEPAIPNADTTVTAEMVKAQNDVKAYMSAAETYLSCVRNDFKQKKMADRMQELAEEFNQTVRAFKERNSKA